MSLRLFGAGALALAFIVSTAAVEARPRENAAAISAKLARFVRPTGRCPGQEWLATYYNSGRRTANGERFDRYAMTAAHRTLAFGTVLKLTNPHTGRVLA
jgi:rare lipoprotein A (peptidoglycan hydrolase)